MSAIYPVNIFSMVNADWVFQLRRMIAMEDLVDVPGYTLARTPKNATGSGFCYLFRGGVEVGDVSDIANIQVAPVTHLLIQGVISSFTFVRQNRPTRNLTFIPDKVVCDVYKAGYDLISVRAHDTFAETNDLRMFNQTIREHFPEFRLDWMEQYPKIDIMAVEKGKGEAYATFLNAAIRWSAVTFDRVYLEMGKDIYTEDIH